MTNLRTLMLLTAALTTTALAGCGANVPEHPTWQNDVHPIVAARCVRCHNAQETQDPLSPGTVVQGNFDHASFDDFTTIDRFLFIAQAAALVATSAVGDAAAPGPTMQMPPPPAATLAQWQIDTITRFVKDNSPTP